MRIAAVLALTSLVGVTLTTAAPPAAAVDVAAALCGNDAACLDELPVTNDATLQAQLDAQPPPTLDTVPVAPVLGVPPLDDPTATTETDAQTAYPIGYVSRSQVTANRYPSTTAAHLAVYFEHATVPTGFCTGALIGPHFVGTVGHCVYQESRGWATRIDVLPGQINSTTGETGGTKPFGTCYADVLFTVRGWKNQHKRSYDYGGIRIGSCTTGDRDVGVRTGTAGFHSSSDEGISGLAVNLHGYPFGAPLYKAGGTMWKGIGGSVYDVETHLFSYKVQTAGGDSGAPVWRSRSDCGPGFCLYGVHVVAIDSTHEAVARRITNGMFRNWVDWRTR